jgi:hypothetical protein
VKTPKATVTLCFFLALFVLPASSSGQLAESLRWGAPVASLQMSISTGESKSAGAPQLLVALRNIGERDVTLNLGVMLANGKAQLPERISLNLTDAGGRTRTLRFHDKRYPAIAGRVDDYVVPLRAGSTYVLTFDLDQFWSPDAEDFQLRLPPGKYQIAAQFEGGGAKSVNLDMPGMSLMNFWTGKLRSNDLVFER